MYILHRFNYSPHMRIHAHVHIITVLSLFGASFDPLAWLHSCKVCRGNIARDRLTTPNIADDISDGLSNRSMLPGLPCTLSSPRSGGGGGGMALSSSLCPAYCLIWTFVVPQLWVYQLFQAMDSISFCPDLFFWAQYPFKESCEGHLGHSIAMGFTGVQGNNKISSLPFQSNNKAAFSLSWIHLGVFLWAPLDNSNKLGNIFIGTLILFSGCLIGRLVTLLILFLKDLSTIWCWRCGLNGLNFLTAHNHLLYNNWITKSGGYKHLLVISFRKDSQAYFYVFYL